MQLLNKAASAFGITKVRDYQTLNFITFFGIVLSVNVFPSMDPKSNKKISLPIKLAIEIHTLSKQKSRLISYNLKHATLALGSQK